MFHGKNLGEIHRKHTKQKYGVPRYKEPRVIFRWKHTTTGQKGLCLIYMLATDHGQDDDFLNWKPTAKGVQWEKVLKTIDHCLPSLRKEFEQTTGKPLTIKIIQSRFGNMFRNNDTRTWAIGLEHPKNHPALQDLVRRMKELNLERKYCKNAFEDMGE